MYPTAQFSLRRCCALACGNLTRSALQIRKPAKRYPITKGSESREMKGSKPATADDADPVNTIRHDSLPELLAYSGRFRVRIRALSASDR